MNLKKEWFKAKYLHINSTFDFFALLFFLFCGFILIDLFPFSILRTFEAFTNLFFELWRFILDFVNSLLGTSFILPNSRLSEYSQYTQSVQIFDFNFERFLRFWLVFFDKDVFLSYLSSLIPKIRIMAYIGMLLLPLFGIFFYAIFHKFSTPNSIIRRSAPLIFFDRVRDSVVNPSIETVRNFCQYLRDNDYYIKSYVLVLILSFNFFSIIFEALAWYFYILITFEIEPLLIALHKLFLDLLPTLVFIPGVFYIAFFVWLFDHIRKEKAYNCLEHLELMNEGFIGSLPIVNFIWGTMGSKKTTMLTDLALSYSARFRFKAYEGILECDLLYPDFPWIRFERLLREMMKKEKGDPLRVYNLRSAGKFVKFLEYQYYNGEFDLFGYHAKMTSSDGLILNELFSVLSDYAKLYLIYVVESSLIISNYGIREDSTLMDLGNFPIWNFDFFRKDPKLSEALSRHSHILDWDLFRLGTKMVKNNLDSDGFEFGIVAITEIGKDRGNKFTLERLDKFNKYDCNQLNDKFNDLLKLIRHFGTVRNFPYVVFLMDDQRPDSLSADVRELSTLINVSSISDRRCCMKFRFLDDYFHDLIFFRFQNLYKKYRFYHADEGLFIVSLKRFVAWIHSKYVVSHNTFDYMTVNLLMEKGNRDGDEVNHSYYLMPKKIYADRFGSDCFSGFVDFRVNRSTSGIMDLPLYCSTHASIDEMQSSNSYLIQDLTRLLLKIKVNKYKRGDL